MCKGPGRGSTSNRREARGKRRKLGEGRSCVKEAALLESCVSAALSSSKVEELAS